ncbi:MAG: TonB-dependent receptor [Rhodocyclaceae bacterium]|nr:TonB-dependent receptor [Rhodocyclaceae bacterium]
MNFLPIRLTITRGRLAFIGLLPSLWVGAVLAEDVADMEAIVVSATRSAHAVGETPVAAFVVNRKQIDNTNAKNVDELVRGIPGAFAGRTKGPMDMTPAITLRGVPDPKRTLVLLDGLPMSDGWTGAQKPMGFTVDDIERAEVILGPASSLYGNNAMGGVVSFESRMPKGREFRYRLGFGDTDSGERGLANSKRTYLSYGDKFQNGLTLLASLGTTDTDGYVAEYVTRATNPPTGTTGSIPTFTTAGARTYIIGDRGRQGVKEQQLALRGELDLGGGNHLRLAFTQGESRTTISEPETYLRNAAGLPALTAGAPNTVAITTWAQGFSYTQRNLLSATYDTHIGRSALKIKLGKASTDYWYISSGTFNYWASSAANITFNPGETLTAEAQFTTPVGDDHLLVWGTDYRHDTGSASQFPLTDWKNLGGLGNRASYFAGRTQTLGFYGQDEWAITSATRATLGARLDFWLGDEGIAQQPANNVNKNYTSRSAKALSPRLGLVHTVSPALALRTSIGSAVRAPNIYDLYRPFISTSATGTYYANNPNLDPETMKSIDFGADAKPWQGAEVTASLYFNWFKNFMYYRSVSATERASICPGIGPLTTCVQKVNVGGARSAGLELKLNQKINDNLSAFVSATALRSKITDNPSNTATVGKRFTTTPHRLASLGVDASAGPWNATLSGRYVGRQFGSSDDTNSQQVWGVPLSFDAHTIYDLKLGYRFDKRMKVSLAIDNVSNHDGFNYYRIPGRSWFLDISGEF